MRVLSTALLLALSLVTAMPAAAEERTECVDAHASAQRLRRTGQFRDAREALASCTRESCPAPVRTDCARFFEELSAVQPTVLLDVHDEGGAPTTGATVALDGAPAVELSSIAEPVDPGAHVAIVTLPSGRSRRLELTVREGTHARIPVSFAPATTAPRAGSPALEQRPWPPLSRGLFAFGATMLVSSAAVGTYALLEGNALEGGCGATRSCDPLLVQTMQRHAVIADVALVTGLVGAAVATIMLLVQPSPPRAVAGTAP